MPHPKLMVMVSFCWKMNFLPSKIKKQIRFIDDALEINDRSCCILSGPPCIYILTVRSIILGGFMGYSGGRVMRPWYTPLAKSESGGPRTVKCHSNRLSCKKKKIIIILWKRQHYLQLRWTQGSTCIIIIMRPLLFITEWRCLFTQNCYNVHLLMETF